MEKITIKTSRSYEVYVGQGLLSSLGTLALQSLSKGAKCVVVTDSQVQSLFLKEAENILEAGGFQVSSFVFPHGESSKNIEVWKELLHYLSEKHLCSTDFLVSLGGGVCGDLTGFAAASFLRGIPYIQVPTTLLSAVDASVGGKTGLNLPAGKNLVGAFWQPSFVLCDTNTFKTLSQADWAQGMAEVIKCAMIRSASLMELLRQPHDKNREDLVVQCVKIKGEIVENDERDQGERQLLNFGHTLGHAIEWCSKYTVSHGEAVAVGMVLITRWAVKNGFCEPSVLETLLDVLHSDNLPTSTRFSPSDLFQGVLMDKKRSGAKNRVIIPREIGDCQRWELDDDQLLQLIEESIEGGS